MKFETIMSDEQIVAVVKAWDKYSLPLSHREDGDDAAINELVDSLDVDRSLSTKIAVVGVVMREALRRGIKI